MIERGAAAKFAISAFYELFNDIDVYVEDTAKGYEKIFANLLTKAAESNLSIDRVFPLGSRKVVVDSARARLDRKDGRPAVYLVDGDLFLLTGEMYDLPENIVVLPRYCVENFLADDKALIEIMDEEDPRLDAGQLRARFDYRGWLDRSTDSLKALFVTFAVSHSFGSGIETVGRGSGSICANQSGEIDGAKVTRICDEIYAQLSQRFGVVVVEARYRAVAARISKEKCFVSTYVSAKDFTLPLFIQRMKEITKSKTPNINIKMNLSKKANAEPLKDVITAIRDKCGKPSRQLILEGQGGPVLR